MSDQIEVLRKMIGWRMPPGEAAEITDAIHAAIAALSAREGGEAKDAFIVPEGAWYAERKGKQLTLTPAQPASQQGEDFEFDGYCGTCGSPCNEFGQSVHHFSNPQAHPTGDKVRENLDLMKAAGMLAVERAEFRILAERSGPLVLLALAEQFDEMALSAKQDGEYERRDVWRNAAEQARFRAKDAAWLAAALDQEKNDGPR